jgi:hypothetical protein
MNIILEDNDFIKKNHKIINNVNTKKDLLMESLTIFYREKNNLDIFLPIINGESKISLRLLDWFVTNYSKKNNINYILKKKSKNINFIVYLDYKAQLKAYSKKQFDPFCRRERISLLDNNDQEIITTVGQLNFFRWAIDNKILNYIHENFENIEQDMTNSLKNLYKKEDNKKTRRKRHELSISATKTINKHNVEIVIDFS